MWNEGSPTTTALFLTLSCGGSFNFSGLNHTFHSQNTCRRGAASALKRDFNSAKTHLFQSNARLIPPKMLCIDPAVHATQCICSEPCLLFLSVFSGSNYGTMSAVTITHGPLLCALSGNKRKEHQCCSRPCPFCSTTERRRFSALVLLHNMTGVYYF